MSYWRGLEDGVRLCIMYAGEFEGVPEEYLELLEELAEAVSARRLAAACKRLGVSPPRSAYRPPRAARRHAPPSPSERRTS